MSVEFFIKNIADYILFVSCLFIVAGSIFLSFKTRFVQIRLLPSIFKMFKASLLDSNTQDSLHTIRPHRALFTAMSTTLGIGTIVAPVIAIHFGGPGALLGFLVTSFFGSAATYIEVKLSVEHRTQSESGSIFGGPMQYLKHIFSPTAAKGYAVFCFVLMMAWSGAQSNQVAAILNSPLMGDYQIPKAVSGGVISLLVLYLLMGGIKRVGSFSAKLVPAMFVLYVGSSLWIILSNLDKLGMIFSEMINGIVHPYQMAAGTIVGGIVSAMRWGIFKGIQVSEAGIGTQTIPHSMAETNDPNSQATVAMLSTYTAGLIAFLSGSVALITGTWEDPELPLGISMVAASFNMYFSSFGIAVVSMAALLFGFGTILGNSFNGSQCYNYLTCNKGSRYYFIATAIMVFVGAMSEVKTFWALSDMILAFMAILHISGLIAATSKKTASYFSETTEKSVEKAGITELG
jgi:AGCS family alanine or glycine:cation symporter